MVISQAIAENGQRNVGVQEYSSTKTNVFGKIKYQANTLLHLMSEKRQQMTGSLTVGFMSALKVVTHQNLSHPKT